MNISLFFQAHVKRPFRFAAAQMHCVCSRSMMSDRMAASDVVDGVRSRQRIAVG
jgi:hypothetical protein